MHTIRTLAASRIKYNRSRTFLTALAIMLTTMLLMALGTSATGISDVNRQHASAAGNVHATLLNITQKQLEKLKNHMDVEAVESVEYFATVENGKMNGFLTRRETLKEGICYASGNLTEGHEAVLPDEICGPASFFERMGVEPVIGNKVTISFRPNGEGMIETREFTICGILSQNISQEEIAKLDISDSKIAYGAAVSDALINEFLTAEERNHMANIRVYGEADLNYNEITAKIEAVAEAVGCEKDNISLKQDYLIAMTDPGMDTLMVVAVIALIIIVFSVLAIYSIYYVSVITDIQEIGKLKAFGASKKQVKRLLLTEGMRVSAFAIPVGLILGFLIPRIALPLIMNRVTEITISAVEIEQIRMFSLPVLFVVTVAVLLTVYLSLLKPMKMASKISPVEAIRYQESSTGAKIRRGKKDVNVFNLSTANLIRNKKRTIVTMITMGLSCVLFMSLAGVMSSMSIEDIARRNIQTGDFRLTLDYSANDKEYPENNLDSLQQQNIFNDEFMKKMEDIDGVERIERQHAVLVSSDHPSELFEDGLRIDISCMDREKAKEYQKKLKRGEIDYDKMIAENGAVFTSDIFFDDYGFAIGDEIPFVVYDGSRQLPLTVKIAATVVDGHGGYFVIPEEVWNDLDMQFDTTTDLYITVDKDKYDSVKSELQNISDSREYFRLYSIDEELRLGSMQVNLVKYPMYLILIMVAVIGFMNLINTMVTCIVTRKRELGILQAVGLSDRQLTRMLAGEGMVFTAGTLLASVTVGNLFGYLVYLWAKANYFMDLTAYHYPLTETIMLAAMLILGQLGITCFIKMRIYRESLIDRIRSGE